MLENPPPEKIACSHVSLGSKKVLYELTCVATADVTKGQPLGKDGLNLVALAASVPGSGFILKGHGRTVRR